MPFQETHLSGQTPVVFINSPNGMSQNGSLHFWMRVRGSYHGVCHGLYIRLSEVVEMYTKFWLWKLLWRLYSWRLTSELRLYWLQLCTLLKEAVVCVLSNAYIRVTTVTDIYRCTNFWQLACHCTGGIYNSRARAWETIWIEEEELILGRKIEKLGTS
jgi:hypothetical protein